MSFDVETITVSPQAHNETIGTTGDDAQRFNEFLSLGIKAAQAGDRSKARNLLTTATDIDPTSENAWLWLASISEYPEELVIFLNHVLEINPHNEKAIAWSGSAKALIAKTLLQRAGDAAAEGLKELAAKCFDQAIEYDPQNEAAWLGLASVTESEQKKFEILERVLSINPLNSEALTAVEAAREIDRCNLLAEARHAAAQGSFSVSHVRLDELLSKSPNCKEAWELRSHITTSLTERRASYEKLLEIDPGYAFAKTGLQSLNIIFAAVPPPAHAETEVEKLPELTLSSEHVVVELAGSQIDAEELPIETIDTGDLIFPEQLSSAAETDKNGRELRSAVEANVIDSAEIPAVESRIKDWSYSTLEANSAVLPDNNIDSHQDEADRPISAEPKGFGNAECQEVTAHSTPSPWTEFADELNKSGEIEIPVIDEAPQQVPDTSQLPEELERSAAPAFATGHSYAENSTSEFDNAELQSTPPTHPGHTVMVIDDNPVIRKLISGKLEECGYMVVCAEDGRSAASMIKQSVPDLILLDITLPQTDGYEVCRNIRMNPAAKNIPVVMISGRDGYYEDDRGDAAGASGFITKPFGPETLMRTVEGHLRNANMIP